MKNEMVPKDVLYNGGNGSYCYNSNSKWLIPFNPYIVEQVVEVDGQLKYKLYGLAGFFNASWFDDVKRILLVYSDQIPKIKKRLECVVADSNEVIITSTLQYVVPITSSMYKVVTRNKSMYLVVVL